MKGEIDRDFYCTGVDIRPMNSYYCKEKLCARCKNKRRKWPTPEQYKEEYKEEWKGATYVLAHQICNGREFWDTGLIPGGCSVAATVCACTPWGKPPDNWRPE